MPQFNPSEIRTAVAPITNPTAVAFDYTAELYLGLPKAASSGVITFSLAPGETKNISFPVTMPDVEGTYPVYLDVFVGDQLIAAYQATEDVVIVPVEALFSIVSVRKEYTYTGFNADYYYVYPTIRNDGNVEATHTVGLAIATLSGGQPPSVLPPSPPSAYMAPITLAPGEQKEVRLPPDYEVSAIHGYGTWGYIRVLRDTDWEDFFDEYGWFFIG